MGCLLKDLTRKINLSIVNPHFDASSIILKAEVVNVSCQSWYLRVEFEMDCSPVHVCVDYVNVLIKTITKFSKVIGYQQPDLSINWTVYA